MEAVTIPESWVREWNAYVEAGVLVLGIRCAPAAQIESIIFQIDLEDSNQRSECMGMYAELDEIGRYAVERFIFDPSLHQLDVALAANAFAGVASIIVQLPSRGPTHLVSRMADVFRQYPRRGG